MKIFTGFSTFISTQMERILLPQTIIVFLHYKLQNSVPFKPVYFDFFVLNRSKYCRKSIFCIIDLSATNIKFEIMNFEPKLSLTKD